MLRNYEQGYFLPEIVVAVFIIGTMIGFILPVYQEVRYWNDQQRIANESMQLMQEEMEKMKHNCYSAATKQESRKSQIYPAIKYQMIVRCKPIKQRFVSGVVQITWKKADGNIVHRKLKSHFFR